MYTYVRISLTSSKRYSNYYSCSLFLYEPFPGRFHCVQYSLAKKKIMKKNRKNERAARLVLSTIIFTVYTQHTCNKHLMTIFYSTVSPLD